MVKNLPANAGDMGLIPGLRRFPGEGDSNQLQDSCLGNPMDRRAWPATVYGVTNESDTVEFSSVSQSRPTLCNPMNYSMPGLPVHHQLPELAQICVH